MKLPLFARGNTEKIAQAVQKQILTYPSYIANTDTNQFGFLDEHGTITYFQGNNKKQIVRCETALPSLEEGDREVLYILGNIVYSFNGEAYIPTYSELKIELDALADRVEATETGLENLDTRLRNAGARIGRTETDIAELKEQVSSYDDAISGISNRMDEVSVGFNEVKDSVDVLAERVDTHRGRLDTIDTALQGLDSRVDVIETHDSVNSNTISNLSDRLGTAETNIQNLQNVTSNHASSIQSINSSITHLTGEVYDLNEKIESLDLSGGSVVIVDGQPVPVKDYVDNRTDSVLAAAKAYTDSEFQWRSL